jgi:hypothetical protein
VSSDDGRRRLVYAIVGDRVAHHSASVPVVPEDAGCRRVEWIIDQMPKEFARCRIATAPSISTCH